MGTRLGLQSNRKSENFNSKKILLTSFFCWKTQGRSFYVRDFFSTSDILSLQKSLPSPFHYQHYIKF